MLVFKHRANNWDELIKASELGIGVEIDVRMGFGKPVLSHDPVEYSDRPMMFSSAVEYTIANKMPVILDIKETGIIDWLLLYIKNDLGLFVATDLIVPDQLYAEKKGLKTLSRSSKYESIEGPFSGKWLDYIFSPEELYKPAKPAILVSPELHKQSLTKEWITKVKSEDFDAVCTDFPERYM